MELKEIKTRKYKLQHELLALLREFEAMTGNGVDIESISFERSSIVRGHNTPPISCVKVKVILD